MDNSSKLALARPLELPGTTAIAQTAWILLFAGVTVLGARVEVPHQPVPYTLQTMAVLLAGAFLGPRNGAISQIAYLVAGVLGAPVFAGGAFGVGPMLGPSGGYLLAFPLAAFIVGFLVSRHVSLAWTVLSMGAGLLLVFVLGTLHLWAFTIHNVPAAINAGFLIFSWWDLLKLGAAAMTYHEVAKRWTRVPASR
jgi:biotin transport system substrate-specific component